MKIPNRPPDFDLLLTRLANSERLPTFFRALGSLESDSDYLHWDELRHRTPPQGFSLEEWWLALKLGRKYTSCTIPLLDKKRRPFRYSMPVTIYEALDDIVSDIALDGVRLEMEDLYQRIREQHSKAPFLQEAVASSQIEGAEVRSVEAEDMIQSNRPPRNMGERMICNNYRAMREVVRIKDQPLTVEAIFNLQRILTEGTLNNPSAAGRFRLPDEPVKVFDQDNLILHDPPPAEDLPARMEAFCAFANDPETSISPVLQAIMLHFWLAYDHPFVDGNGRTARALMYWFLLNKGYDLFEYVSISSIIDNARSQYVRAFLHTETDDNDLTYFILHQLDVIKRAISRLTDEVARTQRELLAVEGRLTRFPGLNQRQQAIIAEAFKHPLRVISIKGHQELSGIAYATARADLLGLKDLGLLSQSNRGKAMLFKPVSDLSERL